MSKQEIYLIMLELSRSPSITVLRGQGTLSGDDGIWSSCVTCTGEIWRAVGGFNVIQIMQPLGRSGSTAPVGYEYDLMFFGTYNAALHQKHDFFLNGIKLNFVGWEQFDWLFTVRFNSRIAQPKAARFMHVKAVKRRA